MHLFEDVGKECPSLLKGMFVFCIHDRLDGSLFLARDRFGEKPLFYHHSGDVFVFSSEIRSLLECELVPRRLDREALAYYLRVGIVPAPLTLFKDVRILPPGHFLYWHRGKTTVTSYYSVDYSPDPYLDREERAVEAVREALSRAVRRQAMSEVPLGAFLSGGIDSSAVVAMLQSVSSRPAKTFTVRFEEASYDESHIARQVANHLGTDHKEFLIPNLAFQEEDLWRIVDHVGVPFFDSSAIPTYILSRCIRQEVTVALSGDGGDELFAGYPVFQWCLSIQKVKKAPEFLRSSAGSIVRRLTSPRLPATAFLRRLRRGLDASTAPDEVLPVTVHALFDDSELPEILTDHSVLESAGKNLPLLTLLPPEAAEWTPLRRLMYYRLKNNLSEDMLTKVDRMSMACSLEVRSPMLDVDLAELSMRLPDKHLIHKGTGKSVLRKAVRTMLPDSVFSHPKTGFDIPLHAFRNDTYVRIARHLLLHDSSGMMDLFSKKVVEGLLDQGLNQNIDAIDFSVYRATHRLWSLMQLAAWAQHFKVRV